MVRNRPTVSSPTIPCTRRTFSAVIATGVVGLSGCLGGEDDDENGSNDEVAVEDHPDDAAVHLTTPEDGDTVTSPIELSVEVDAVDLVAADEAAVGEAHVHLLLDQECFDDGETIPGPGESAEEDGVFHWGDGSSEGELELEPGEYDLCAQLGDGPHRAFGETDEISFTVEE